MALHNYQGPLAPQLNFVKNSLTHFYSLFNSSSALYLIAEHLATATADTSFKVYGLTRLRIEPSLPTFKTNALNHQAMALACNTLSEVLCEILHPLIFALIVKHCNRYFKSEFYAAISCP